MEAAQVGQRLQKLKEIAKSAGSTQVHEEWNPYTSASDAWDLQTTLNLVVYRDENDGLCKCGKIVDGNFKQLSRGIDHVTALGLAALNAGA